MAFNERHQACKVRETNFIWDLNNQGQMMLFDFQNLYSHGFNISSEVQYYLGNQFYFQLTTFQDQIRTYSYNNDWLQAYFYDIKRAEWDKSQNILQEPEEEKVLG